MSQHDEQAVQDAAADAADSYADWWSTAYIQQQREEAQEQEDGNE
jgi:hypothetical protein